jgi:hypothetical protein
MMRKLLVGTALALLAFSSAASANTVLGSLWENEPVNATPGNVPGTTPDVTFTVNSPFTFTSGGAYTIGEFLASAGATPLTGFLKLGDTLNNTIFNFTGQVTVTTGQTFTVTHDDGLTLIINGITVIDEPGPTSPVTDTHTYTGASGTFSFQLVYSEVQGPPAELQISLPLQSAVPEPSTWAMMIIGFAGLGYMGFRHSRKQATLAA